MENQELYNKFCVKFFSKEITDEELEQLNIWLKESDENKISFNQISELWYSRRINQFDTEKAWLATQKRINTDRKNRPAKTILFPKKRLQIWKAAAIFILLITIPTLYYIIDANSIFNDNKSLFTVIAPKGEKAQLTLIDGTKVWLNSGSTLKYSTLFSAENRKVILEGEGFFEVVKDPSHPFIVMCDETEVLVHGTSFNISNYRNDLFIQLTLVTGKLSFYTKSIGKPIALEPCQQLTYFRKTGTTSLQNINTDLYTIWKENQLKFDNTPFIEVIKKMERWYDVDINLEPTLQNTENYTMTVKTESLREILEMLKLTTPFEYRIDKEKVYIYNKKVY